MTIEHNVITDPELHEPKGVAAAVQGQVYIANGSGSGAWGKTGGNAQVVINTESDFPTPSAGVITFDDDINYVMGANVTTANRFVVGNNNSITSGNINGPTLHYTGTGDMFTGVDNHFTAFNISLNSPTATVFNISDTVGGTRIFSGKDVRIVSCAKYGVFNDLAGTIIDNSDCLDADDGITIVGPANITASFVKLALQSTSASFIGIDLGASVSQNIEMDNLVVLAPAGSVGISGAASSANLLAGATGTITNSTFLLATPLAGLTVDDIRWSYEGNSANVENTLPDAMGALNGNATNTVIGGAGTEVKVLGTWTIEEQSHFTVDATGKITYIGERDIKVPISIVVSMAPVSGTNKNLTVGLALNGTIITKTKMPRLTNSGAPGLFPCNWQLTLSTGDFLEVFISNETDTVDILVGDGNFRVL